jgi:hypothetical protein
LTAASRLPALKRLRFEADGAGRLTHHLFRFPAKFHPPIVRQLLTEYTEPGDCILDPFCGSGTLLVEASVLGRNSIGIDVDPVSVFVSGVKSHALSRASLEVTASQLDAVLRELERSPAELATLADRDLDEAEYVEQLNGSWVPQMPRLEHWFYRYAIVDLAVLLDSISRLDAPQTHRDFFKLVFAATIRSASRADPVPVSGLEVTRVMLEKEEAGRSVEVASLFRRRLAQALKDMEAFHEAKQSGTTCRVFRGDAATLRANLAPKVDAAITSPPYHGAVDYYRRHKLEMFWLAMTEDQPARLALLEHYLGRPKVPQRHPYVGGSSLELPGVATVEKGMREVSGERANAFKHYAIGMSKAIANVARRTRPGAPFILVVGHSTWNGGSIDTSALMEELAQPHFTLADRFWYPVKNRYMSYERKNGANIDREYVLTLERSKSEV